MKMTLLVAVLAGIVSTQANGQDVPPGPLIPPIDVEKIEIKKSKKADEGWILSVSASKAREIKLPEGAVLDLELRLGVTPVYFFTYELGSKSRFKIEEKTGLSGVAQGVLLQLKVLYEKQPTAVRDYIDSKPELFPKKRSWSYKYAKQRFDFGDPKDLENQKAEVRGFFKAKIEGLVALDRKFSAARKQAIAGEGFQKSGKFDPVGWQKWIEKECRDPIRAIQADIRNAPKLKFLMARRDLEKYLTDLSRAVAKRTYERSRSMYESLGLSPDPADSAPKNIDANSRKFESKHMRLTIERIQESQEIKDLDI